MTFREKTNKAIGEYQRTRSVALRNEIAEAHLALVQNIATHLQTLLVHSVEVDDLFSFGFFGLLDAIEKFSADRGVSFSTYASRRIAGAAIDGLRTTDETTRSSRIKGKRLDEVSKKLTVEHGRPPTPEELCEALGFTPEKFATFSARAPRERRSLELPMKTDGGRMMRLGDLLADRQRDTAGVHADCEKIIDIVLREFGLLHALFLRLRFIEGMTLVEISQVLGDNWSESYWSIRQRELLPKLRRRFSLDPELLAGRRVA